MFRPDAPSKLWWIAVYYTKCRYFIYHRIQTGVGDQGFCELDAVQLVSLAHAQVDKDGGTVGVDPELEEGGGVVF